MKLPSLSVLLGRKARAERALEVFRTLKRQVDPRFEDCIWTNEPGGDESAELIYRVAHQEKRQLTWLSYVSSRLREISPRGKLLDVGSNIFWAVGVAASARDITVVDVRAHPLAQAFPFRFVQTSVLDLPFEDEEFDIVTVPQLLHHIGLTFGQVVRADEYRTGLDELTRVLKIGGQAILSTWVKGGRTIVGAGRPRVFGAPHLRHLLAERGLEIVDCHFISHSTFREIREEELHDASKLPADWVLATLRKRQADAAD